MPKTLIRRGALALCVFLVACASLRVARYDPVTIKSLTDLGPVASRVYDSFVQAQIDQARVDEFELQLEQIEAYERWKEDNEDMVNQVKELRGMFADHLADRKANGPWSSANVQNSKQLFYEALKITVETEAAKNRSRK